MAALFWSDASRSESVAELVAHTADRRPSDTASISSWGTGFVVDHDGHLVTARHVVAACRALAVARDGERYPAQLVSVSETDDLAVVQAPRDIGEPLAFAADRHSPEPLVTVLGYAALIAAREPGLRNGTGGFNAEVLDDSGTNMLTLASTARPGVSGSPVLADDGRVLGVLVNRTAYSGGMRQGRIPRAVHHAVRADRTVAFLRQLGIAVSQMPPDHEGMLEPLAILSRSEVRVECYTD